MRYFRPCRYHCSPTMRPAGIFAPDTNPCFTKTAAYEKGNQKKTPVKGKTNKSLTKQNTVRHGQNTTNKHFNFSKQSDYELLKLTTMKKQLLILVLAIIGFGLSQTHAQVITPTPLDPACIDLTNPLTPVPGNDYTYEVDIPFPTNGTKSFRWYVTQDVNFATAGTYNWATAEAIGGPILATGEAHYNALTPGANSIVLSWQSFVLNPGDYVFVVVYVENERTDAPTCTTNNIKIYRIQPLHAFTLDIANVDSTASAIAAANFPTCIDDVQSAVFDPAFGTDGGVVYNFGQNVLYYAVAAANFSGQYNLQAQFNGLQGPTGAGAVGQVAAIYWDYTPLGNGNGPFAVTNGTTLDLGDVEAQDPTGTVGSDGEMIYIKVVINHNSFEAANNLDEYAYTFAINGVLVDASGNPLAADDSFDDLHHGDCQPDLFVNDIVTQRLLTRPTVISVSPVPGAPNPVDGYLPIAP